MAAIYRDRLFWRFAPLYLSTTGSTMAFQSLWAGPWLHDVGALDAPSVASHLLILSLLQIGSYFLVGFIATELGKRNVPLIRIVQIGSALYISTLTPLLLPTGTGMWSVILGIGLLSNVNTLCYPILSQYFSGGDDRPRDDGAQFLLLRRRVHRAIRHRPGHRPRSGDRAWTLPRPRLSARFRRDDHAAALRLGLVPGHAAQAARRREHRRGWPMSTIIAIRHLAFEDLANFEGVLKARGHDIRYIDAATDDLAALPHDLPAPLFVLGGPIGAYEEAFILSSTPSCASSKSVSPRKLPIFGICLGAQLMARALGARVYPAQAKELGWAPIALTEAGQRSVLKPLGAGPVLHWHGDTFDLPPGATRLASTAICENQAFGFGANVLALQFHIEAEAKGLERWYVGHTMELAAAKIAVPTLRAQSQELAPAAAARGNACLTAWLDAL